MEEELEIDEQLFALYGRVFFHAQNLEKSLQTLLFLYNNSDIVLSDEELQVCLDVKATKSMGDLTRSLGELQTVDKLETQLRTATDRRNYLAHEFFL